MKNMAICNECGLREGEFHRCVNTDCQYYPEAMCATCGLNYTLHHYKIGGAENCTFRHREKKND